MIRLSFYLLLFASFSLTACEIGLPAGSEPFTELNYANMADQPKLKPQRKDLFGENPVGMTAPAEGAVAMGERPYRFKADEVEKAEAFYDNPLSSDPQTLEHGKWIFNNYCIVCHGPGAAGDGHLTKLFPKPPHLMRQRARDYPDGRIFHIANRGQASMPRYAKQLEPDDIWSVIRYIRKMQADSPVAAPSENDLKELKEKAEAAKAAESATESGQDGAIPAAPTESGEDK